MATEVLQQDFVHPEPGLHARKVRKGAQRAAKNQTVEPGKYSGNLILRFCDKLFPGLSVPLGCVALE
jgi:hypothetical protein